MSITATNNTAFFLNLRNNYEDIIPNYTIPDYHSEISGIACGAAVSSVGGHFWGAAVGGIFDGISLKTDGLSKNKNKNMNMEMLKKEIVIITGWQNLEVLYQKKLNVNGL